MNRCALEAAIIENLEKYFSHLGDMPATHIYDMVIQAVEKPMLELVMKRTLCNQSQAADILGMNRNTLRKKLQQYDLL